jgi:hypothetical protein
MKTLIAVVFFCIFSNTVFANDDDEESIIIKTEIPCYNTDSLLNTLKKEYKEVPILYGISSDQAESTMSVWTSPSTKSWSIIATKGEISCIIGTGIGFKFVPIKVGKSI